MTFNKEEIKSILSNVLECTFEDITDNILLTELGYDSLKFISTVVEIEKKYNIEILDSDLVFDNFKDLLSICNTIKKYFNNNSSIYKCIITDCDGVLWHGIAGESGNDKAYTDKNTNQFCEMLKSIQKKGVLLTICSKNDLQNIEYWLKKTTISADNFAIIETTSLDKTISISRILNEVGFDADNVLYIDDSDAEIEYVKNKVHGLNVLKAEYDNNFLKTLSNMFSSIPTSYSIDRTTQFREQKEREKIHHQTSSIAEYNHILETKIICSKALPNDALRIAELSQRANRFNLTGAQYTEENIKKIMNDSTYSIYKLCANDKFGDMGLVAIAIVHDNVIESFIMSCRVLGRGFEYELLNVIKANCNEEIIGIYIPTDKNNYCKNFYKDIGMRYELH